MKIINLQQLNKAVTWVRQWVSDTFVSKDGSKVLSTNDYTNEAKTKVDAIPLNPKYTDTTYDVATASTNGLMSATDKQNVDSNTGARHTHTNKVVIDKFSDVGGKPYYNGNAIGGAVPNLTLNELTLGDRFKISYNDIEDSLDIEVI